ncbi:MAG: hypothetical protein GDA46_01090 [Bdellovibrionales bacterium]|nr:hypothetical protein [Bdellovibrionales bacterium]
MSRFLICFFFLYSQLAFPKNKVWIRGNRTDLQEFQVFLKNSDIDLSYAKFQWKQKVKRSKKFKLKEKLLLAQQLYLEGEKERSEKLFNQISLLAYLADWDKEDRRILLYSFLRAAQLQEDKKKRQALLILAKNFSLSSRDFKTSIDFKLFPPPLIDELRKIQEKSNFLVVNWNSLFPDHEILLLNGKRIDKNKKLKLVQTYYRVTALSSSHQAWSEKISLSNLLLQKIKTARLTLGTCETLRILPELEKQKNIKLFPISKCKTKHLEGILAKNSEKMEELVKKDSHLPSWFLLVGGAITVILLLFLRSEEPEEEYVY